MENPDGKKVRYSVDGSYYDIPSDRVEEFEKAKPQARQVYRVGEDEYAIPLDQRENFTSQNPNAEYWNGGYVNAEAQPQAVQQPQERGSFLSRVGRALSGAEMSPQGMSQQDSTALEQKQGQTAAAASALPEGWEERSAEFDDDYNAYSSVINARLAAKDEARKKRSMEREKGMGAWLSSIYNAGQAEGGAAIVPQAREEIEEGGDAEADQLRAASSILESAKRRKDAAYNKKGLIGGLADSFTADTWDFGVTDLKTARQVNDLAKKLEAGEELTENDNILLEALVQDAFTNEYYGDQLKRGYKAGQVTGESLPFMLEFMLNPLAGGERAASGGAIKVLEKRLAKEMAKRAERAGVKGMEKTLLEKGGELALKGAARGIDDLLSAGGIAATTGAGRTAADAYSRKNGQVQYHEDEDGNLTFDGLTGGEKDWWKAAAKAYGATTIEDFSEMFGNYFRPIGQTGKKALFAMNKKLGLGKVNKMIDGIGSAEWVHALDDFLERTDWNGVGGEFGEEIVGGVMNALTVGDQKLDASEEGVFNKDNLIDTFLGVAVFGGFVSAMKTAGYRTASQRNEIASEKASKQGESAFGDYWNTLKGIMDEDGENAVRYVLGWAYAPESGLTDEQKSAVGDYARLKLESIGMEKGRQKKEEYVNEGVEEGKAASTPEEIGRLDVDEDYARAKAEQEGDNPSASTELEMDRAEAVRQGRRESVRDNIAQQVGQPFWSGEEGQESVRSLTYPDGREVYFVAQDENGNYATVDADGNKGFMTETMIAEATENEGAVDATVPLGEYLNGKLAVQDTEAEQLRMQQDQANNLAAVQQRVQEEGRVNLGTPEAEVWGTVIGIDPNPQGGVAVQVEGEQEPRIVPWSEVAKSYRMPFAPKTNQEVANARVSAEDEVKRFNQAITPGTRLDVPLVGAENGEVASYEFRRAENVDGEVIIKAYDPVIGQEVDLAPEMVVNMDAAMGREMAMPVTDVQGNPVPEVSAPSAPVQTFDDPVANELGISSDYAYTTKKGQTVVDGSKLWAENPTLWAEWNDRNPNRVIPTKEYLESKLKDIEKEVGAARSALEEEVKGSQNPDRIEELQANLSQKESRQQEVQSLVAKYESAEAIRAQAEAEAQRMAEQQAAAEAQAEAPAEVEQAAAEEVQPSIAGEEIPAEQIVEGAQVALNLANTMEERAEVIQQMLNAMGAERTVVTTMDGLVEAMRKAGESERALSQVQERLDEIRSNGGRLEGFYDPNTDIVFMVADGLPTAAYANRISIHEGKHMENHVTGAQYDALSTGITRDEMLDVLWNYKHSRGYRNDTNSQLADEALAVAAEIAEEEGVDAVPGRLRELGVVNEDFINFAQNNVENGRRNGQRRHLGQRDALQPVDTEVAGRENERDQGEEPGDLGGEVVRPDEGSEEGTRGGEEPAESGESGESGIVTLQQAEQDLANDGLAANEEEVRFSVRYAPKESEVDAIAEDIATATGVSKEKARQWVESETGLVPIIMDEQNSPYLDYEGDDRYTAIKSDSDYPQGTVDFNNICRKRLPFTEMYQRIQRDFPNTIITGDDLATIRNIMKSHGLMVACGLCYVEDRRQLLGEIAQGFIVELSRDFRDYEKGSEQKRKNAEKFRKLVGDDHKEDLSIYDLLTLEGSSRLAQEHPGIYNAFQAFNNARGQQSGNLFQGYAEYKREILRWSKKKVAQVNSLGGLRIFSYSDFEAHHLIDLVQIIQDCAKKGVMIQGYTKVPAFARIVAGTNVKLNRSLIPLGETGIVDGRLAYDPVEGIDINDPDFLPSNDNIGNILIGINDEQIRLAMADPFVHFIIPYHSNQSSLLRKMKQTGAWTNYKNEQTEKALPGTDKGSVGHGVNIYTDVLAAAKKEGNPITNEREFTEKYLQVCKERGLKPVFARFLDVDEEGGYKYVPGYYKMLVDFKLFDENGNILPQKPVVAEFDDAFNQKVLEDYVRDVKAESGENLDGVYEEIVKELGLVERSASKLTDAQKKALAFVNGETIEEEEAIRPSISGDTQRLFDAAKERFGVTKDIREAGYVLPDGAMLDFSGRHWLKPGDDSSYLAGDRTVDHRDIQDIGYERDGNTPTGIKTSMSDFISRGAIRIHDGSGASINLAVKPTPEQVSVLTRLIEHNNGDVYLDLGDGEHTNASAYYDKTRPNRIINDIKRYFDEGVEPAGSIRFSLRGISGAENDAVAMQNLDIAEEMEAAGKDAKTIWQATGWERGADKGWRNEIPDGKPKVLPMGKKSFKVKDLIEAPELFESYPEIADYKVSLKKTSGAGSFNPTKKEIELDSDYNVKTDIKEGSQEEAMKYFSEHFTENIDRIAAFRRDVEKQFGERKLVKEGVRTLMHEIQHAIQSIEGFARGGSSRGQAQDILSAAYNDKPELVTFARWFSSENSIAKLLNFGRERMLNLLDQKRNIDALDEESKRRLTELRDYISDRLDVWGYRGFVNEASRLWLDSLDKGEMNYNKLAGEVEARNVEKRSRMTEEERRNTPPSETEDVAREEQGVRFSVSAGRVARENNAVFDGKRFFSGSVNLKNGKIEETHTYEDAKEDDFGTGYFSKGQQDKMESGESSSFYIDEDGKPRNGDGEEFSPDIEEAILKQVYPSVLENRVIYNGAPIYAGSINVKDGAIEETHSYEDAERSDFDNYFSPEQEEKIDSGDNVIFWIDENGIHFQGDITEEEKERLTEEIRNQVFSIRTTPVDESNEIRFSIREGEPPKKTGIGYKVFYQKDGKLYPPMVANAGGVDTPVGVWLDAEAAPIVGESKTGRPKVKQGGKGTQGGSGTLAYRPGWHLGEIPYALQFNRINPETGKKELFPKDFVWAEVEYAMDNDYQQEAEAEGMTEGGKFRHSYAGLKRVPENGYYRYRTNPNPETDPWIITGAMKVNRILSNEEVDDLVRQAGREPQQREGDVRFSIANDTSDESKIAEGIVSSYDNQDGSEQYPWVDNGELVDRIEKELPYGVKTKPIFAKIDEYRRLDEEDFNEGRRDFSGGEKEELFNEILSDLQSLARNDTGRGGDLRFSVANANQEVFVSNAQRAVENIRQEKATPEQWLKMIEKGGGMKAGEDKWLGLSDWLKGQDKKSITKQEILDYIGENKIIIEETRYTGNLRDEIQEHIGQGRSLSELQSEIDEIRASEEYKGLAGDRIDSDLLTEVMIDRYGDDFEMGYIIDEEGMIDYDIDVYADREYQENYTGKSKPINFVRRGYTTEGLENNAEIALTVPTIEPWNEQDDIHFGDAGGGRAIAWVRFGDAFTGEEKYDSGLLGNAEEARKSMDEYTSELMKKYGLSRLNQLDSAISKEERDKMRRLQKNYTRASWHAGESRQVSNEKKVLFIDEIQSKRHQEAREMGWYKGDAEYTRKLEELRNERMAASRELDSAVAQISKEYDEPLSRTWNSLVYPLRSDTTEKTKRLREKEARRKYGDETYERIVELERKDGDLAQRLANLIGKNEDGVPAAPFEKNWAELSMKRMLRYAAENGYDYVAWTTGEQQAERYSLGEVLSSVDKTGDNDYTLYLTNGKSTDIVVDDEGVITGTDAFSEEWGGKRLSEVVGKDLAVKMMSMEVDSDDLEHIDSRIGGEGMKGFYDEILPRFMNKYGKQWGVKVEDITLPDLGYGGITAHSVPVNEAMKESVMEGQLMFSVSQQEQTDRERLIDAAENGGLKAVIGPENVEDIYREAYASIPQSALKPIVEKGLAEGGDIMGQLRVYLHDLALNGTENDGTGLLFKLFEDIRYMSNNPALTDNDIRWMLWKETWSEDPDSILAIAANRAMRNRWGVGEPPVEQDFKEAAEDAQKAAAERVETAKNDLKEEKKGLYGPLDSIAKAMAAQKTYDKATVDSIVRFAKDILKGGNVSELSRREVSRLLSLINTSTGKSPKQASRYADQLVEMLLNHIAEEEKKKFEKLVKVKASKVKDSGVEVQGKLDLVGQAVIKAFRENMGSPVEDIRTRLEEVSDQITSEDDAVREGALAEYSGLMLALQYKEDIAENIEEYKDLKKEFDATGVKLADVIGRKAYEEFVKESRDALRKNLMERIDMYRDLSKRLTDIITGSAEAAAAFRKAEQQRVEEIHHDANRDMKGTPSNEHLRENAWQRFLNSDFIRFFFKSLSTADQMFRLLGRKSVTGEGYLFNRFIKNGFIPASEKASRGILEATQILDKKVSEVFGKKGMRWSDLYKESRKKGGEVEFLDGGEMKTHDLTQGNLLYIYMANKMPDGKMKLRKMGIGEDTVEEIKKNLDPRFIELADWLQDEFYVNLRNKYNAVHERMFGAPMAAIEDYVPLKILANARFEDVDLGAQTQGEMSSTITGSIIKRRKNSLALDIMHTDAFSLAIEHIEQMEDWAAFAELRRDMNTLLSYKHFRNQVMNMDTVYGSGRTLWSNFSDACTVLVGKYQPKVKKGDIDTIALNVAKGVTAAKISFRVNTALKQLLSFPAYFSDARPDLLAASIGKTVLSVFRKGNAGSSWKWCMENLPLFEKRWKSRIAGDTRLLDTESDWKIWKDNVVKTASRLGMTPNAFIDATTVAIGAKAMYDTKRARYIKDGYSEEKADEMAKRDAEILYNQTQQSSENAFVAPVQLDRTWWSVALTTYRNASMSYQRQLHDALRTMGKMMKPGYRQRSIDFMTHQNENAGLEEEEARKAAKRDYNRQYYRNLVRVALFGYGLQFLWEIGNDMIYLLFGDDDDEKEKILKVAALSEMAAPVEGLVGGNTMSDRWGRKAEKKVMAEYGIDKKNRFGSGNGISKLPIESDFENISGWWESDEARAVNGIINLFVQAGVGVNPQTLTDAVVAAIDYADGDLDKATEMTLLAMRILQVPQSTVDKLLADEIDMEADPKERKAQIDELAKRYAMYMLLKNTTVFNKMYDEGKREKKLESYENRFKDLAKERIALKRVTTGEEIPDAPEDFYKSFEKAMKAFQTEYNRTDEKHDNDTLTRRVLEESPEYQQYLIWKKHQKGINKLNNGIKKTQDDNLRQQWKDQLDESIQALINELNENK